MAGKRIRKAVDGRGGEEEKTQKTRYISHVLEKSAPKSLDGEKTAKRRTKR